MKPSITSCGLALVIAGLGGQQLHARRLLEGIVETLEALGVRRNAGDAFEDDDVALPPISLNRRRANASAI
jgi:hypothetical protein